MKVERVVNSFIEENTFIIYENDTCIIVDPGSDFNKIDFVIQENNLKNINIYLTHGHIDHIVSVNDISKKYDAPVFIHELEIPLLKKPSENMSTMFYDRDIEVKNAIGVKDKLDIPALGELNVYHTPGHTYGHSMLEVKKINTLFTGDFVFYHEIGRCDLPTGSIDDMYNSLDKLKTFNPKLEICPGHGQYSSVGEEIKYNPYMNR
ncbi:hydroxyacylglutathione hydrolase [Bacilli bacterium PM5-3]|nr:hydroxyacylglutathione hydrolase [Bacilli bacterium PM5-3]MDH6603037.1 hydroxyacylglutathione hydrolase [Bacilli bacterium PM5-9]